MRTLILGLGNDLIADDAVGPLAAGRLAVMLRDVDDIDVEQTAAHGLALLDVMLGYDRVVLLDAILTGRREPGTITRVEPDTFRAVESPSPHFAGLPELIDLARRLELSFPSQFVILAVEVADLATIGGPMTDAVRRAIPQLCEQVVACLGCAPAMEVPA